MRFRYAKLNTIEKKIKERENEMDLHDYKDVAENYDLYLDQVGGSYDGFEDYYLNLASKYGEDGIIDIACGTGVLTIPFARAGYDVSATDLSEPMVEITKQKLINEKLEATCFTGNMIDFSTDNKYSLAIIARSGFMHLLTYEDQEKALLNIRKHLVKGGILTLNTFEPNYNIQLKQIHTKENDYEFRAEYTNSEGQKEKIYHSISYNPETQIMGGTWKFVTYDENDNVINERIRDLKMRQSYSIQIHYLAEKCGYKVLEAEMQKECNNNIIWILQKNDLT